MLHNYCQVLFPKNCNRTTKYNYVIAVKNVNRGKNTHFIVYNVYFLFHVGENCDGWTQCSLSSLTNGLLLFKRGFLFLNWLWHRGMMLKNLRGIVLQLEL